MANETNKSPRDTFLRTVAVLGLIAVLLLGAWGIITLAVNLPNFFSSIGSGVNSALTPSSTASLTVSAAQTVASGQSLEISWTLSNAPASAQYSYSISYSCVNGLSMKAPVPTGDYQSVACNTAFNYVNATQHMILIPTLSSGTSAMVSVTVSATDLSTGAIVAQGSTNATVTRSGAAASNTAAASTAASKTSTPATTYYPAQKAATSLYGYADLAVVINSVTPSGNLESVTFTIENIGTNRAPAGWNFTALLPVNGSYTFTSQTQRALNPGDKVAYTLSFERPANYNYNGGYGTTGCGSNYGVNYNCGTTPYYQYPNANYPYTCNNYGPCSVPGYVNLYPYGTPYQNGYCPQGYACSVPFSQYNNSYNNGYSYGAGTITITADPYNLVTEANKANNTATAQAY